MAGSGIEELLGSIYAANTVGHMLTGKAIARAVRGHLLTETALCSMLLSQMYPGDIETGRDPIDTDLKDLVTAFDSLVEKECFTEIPQFEHFKEKLKETKIELSQSRTAKLWIQHMDMIDILHQFITAERTGDWLQHLECLSAMLPYLAASGHNLYTKSIYIYLQKMSKLEETHPVVYRYYTSGNHVIRRSDRFWAGLSTDLIIEQVLMRSLKTRGGLTRGRGMGELQRSTWLLAMPVCAEVNYAMQHITGASYETSEQHKDASKARIERDSADIRKIIAFLEDRNPFSPDQTLRNISTGLTAESTVDVDSSRENGMKIVNRMAGLSVAEHTFKRSEQSITLATKNSKSTDQTPVIQPELLFQRYILAAESYENPAEVFQHELCSHPPALFEYPGMMRKAIKPVLADAIWKQVNSIPLTPLATTYFVLDGGSLLQRLPWPKHATYNAIATMYAEHIQRSFGNQTTVIFDSYLFGWPIH